MSEHRLNFVKEALARCKAAQDQATAAWHLDEPQTTAAVCPPQLEQDPAGAGAGVAFAAVVMAVASDASKVSADVPKPSEPARTAAAPGLSGTPQGPAFSAVPTVSGAAGGVSGTTAATGRPSAGPVPPNVAASASAEHAPATDPLTALALAQHLMNFKLWHTEDQARRKDVDDAVIAACKRSIDALNQRRNDFMEKVDACIVAMCLPHLPAPAEGRRPRYNTESVGAAVDRLSIISLKAYHMREETERTDADAAHIDACRHKLTTLLDQRDELFTAILELIDDYAAGRTRPRVYYQFKMYNDPRLNPALYKNRQS